MKNIEYQSTPVADSPNNDAFEGLVELYYQLDGFITSSGKWFWVKGVNKDNTPKAQRGYQDIDVLAINGDKTIIVSASTNFDDKISFNMKGELNKKSESSIKYFNRVKEYLRSTKEYSWMIKEPRKVIYNLVCINTPKKLSHIERSEKILNKFKIELISVEKIIDFIIKNKEGDGGTNKFFTNVTIQNQMLSGLAPY